MGDRAHVYVHEGDRPGVWIYTHWRGYELPELVRDALNTPQARARIHDTGYLTRILISQLTAGADPETGWGVDTVPSDTGDGHRVVDVDTAAGTVQLTVAGYGGLPVTVGQYTAGPAHWPGSD